MAVAGHPAEPAVFFFGSTGGGVWRTTDAGSYWTNVSDGYFERASVGALAVAPSDPNVIYAGMGEATIRGNVSHGDGVYRSTDGGRSWVHLGLTATRHIGKVRVDPRDPDTAYVAALGHAHGPNPERGLYRTRDGGASWSLVLARGPRAGAVDTSIDPTNPRIVYASTWETFRHPWMLQSGGPGSGLFRSSDGGDTWTDLSRSPGFPTGVLGKIGVVASPARSGRVWAIVEAAEGGVYRSDDDGATWTKCATDSALWYRSYYYMHIVADPLDPHTVWVLNTDCFRSTDGGMTFERVATPHGDSHDLWIDPRAPRRMIVGCDMGAAVTHNGGETWSSLYNQPTAELYHVATDSRTPYRVYGTQQDCGTVSLPSRSMLAAITNAEARDVGGGESGFVAVRPDQPDIVFSGQFAGHLTRFDERTGQARNIEVWPEAQAWASGASAVRHRFSWSAPVALSPHDPNVLYVTGERVFRSTDEGARWTAISPDLTRNDRSRMDPPGALIRRDGPASERERVCTIVAFAESPAKAGVLWAGTDDGRVQTSPDGGRTWREVTPRGVRPWTFVSCVEPSPHDPAVAYLAATRYLLDDFRPLLFRTANGGRTWTKITVGIPDDDFTRVIREDPERRGLLFAGSETGVYVSFDDGATWQRLKGNLPAVPVHDLVVKEDDLVAGTHGRGFWIIDDIGTLRQDLPRVLRNPVRLFKPGLVTRFPQGGRYRKPALRHGHNYSMEGYGSIAWAPLVRPGFRGERFFDAARNPPDGAVVRYLLARAPRGEVTLAFAAQGRVIRRFTSREGADEPSPPKAAGLHTFVWDLRHPGATPLAGPGGGGRRDRPTPGPFIVPGRYEVTLEVDGSKRSASFEVRTDPRTGVSQADLEAQLALLLRLRDQARAAHAAINEIRAERARLDALGGRAAAATASRRALATRRVLLDAIEGALTQVPGAAPSPVVQPPPLLAKLAGLSARVASAGAAPTRASRQLADLLCRRIAAQLARRHEASGSP